MAELAVLTWTRKRTWSLLGLPAQHSLHLTPLKSLITISYLPHTISQKSAHVCAFEHPLARGPTQAGLWGVSGRAIPTI